MEEQMSSKWRKADKGYPGPDTLSTRTRPNQMREKERERWRKWLTWVDCRIWVPVWAQQCHTLTYSNSHWHWAQLRWFADASWFSVSSTYSQMDRKAPPTSVSEWATDWMNGRVEWMAVDGRQQQYGWLTGRTLSDGPILSEGEGEKGEHMQNQWNSSHIVIHSECLLSKMQLTGALSNSLQATAHIPESWMQNSSSENSHVGTQNSEH